MALYYKHNKQTNKQTNKASVAAANRPAILAVMELNGSMFCAAAAVAKGTRPMRMFLRAKITKITSGHVRSRHMSEAGSWMRGFQASRLTLQLGLISRNSLSGEQSAGLFGANP